MPLPNAKNRAIAACFAAYSSLAAVWHGGVSARREKACRLPETVDLNQECRIVIQSESNHRELNFCGLVIMKHLEQSASLLNDNLLQQCRDPETPAVQIKIPYSIAEFSNGQEVPTTRKEGRKDE